MTPIDRKLWDLAVALHVAADAEDTSNTAREALHAAADAICTVLDDEDECPDSDDCTDCDEDV